MGRGMQELKQLPPPSLSCCPYAPPAVPSSTQTEPVCGAGVQVNAELERQRHRVSVLEDALSNQQGLASRLLAEVAALQQRLAAGTPSPRSDLQTR